MCWASNELCYDYREVFDEKPPFGYQAKYDSIYNSAAGWIGDPSG